MPPKPQSQFDIRTILPIPLPHILISNINILNLCPQPIFKLIIDLCICNSLAMNSFQLSTEIIESIHKRLQKIIKIEKISQKFRSINTQSLISVIKQFNYINKRYQFYFIINLQNLENIINFYQLRKNKQSSSQNNLIIIAEEQLEEIKQFVDNCIKYLKIVFKENTLLNDGKYEYIKMKIIKVMMKKIQKYSSNKIKTNDQVNNNINNINNFQWSIFNLKKCQLINVTQNNNNKSQLSQVSQPSYSTIQPLNKLYIKLSFQSITPQLASLLLSINNNNSHDNSHDNSHNHSHNYNTITKSSLQHNKNNNKCFTLSLIDFKLVMEEMDNLKSNMALQV